MGSFSLVIEYLTGYAVSTDPSSRERAEWPPHPARVYMAMAAAYFETDGPSDAKRHERDALEWLATLPPPDLVIPPHSVRDVLEVYVPVNDQKGGEALGKRLRKSRTFPRVHVGGEAVRFVWRVDPVAWRDHIRAIEAVCRAVTRIGHSSSLVWMRIEDGDGDRPPTFVPDEQGLSHRLRVPSAGTLARLEAMFNREAIDAYVHLDTQIAASKGAAKRSLRLKQSEAFPHGPPMSRPPVISLHQGYRIPSVAPVRAHPSLFDPNFIVLRAADESGRTFGLESTPRIIDALRGAILSTFGDKPVPAWVSGHEPNGERLQSEPHMAIAPLAFVGSQYADGHLMGFGVMIPRTVPLTDRGRALAALLFDQTTGDSRVITLKLGVLGTWDLVRESAASSKHTLHTGTYTDPSVSWASVTPILLDRMPKSDRVREPLVWREEVAAIISKSCANVGLPEPLSIRVEKTPFFHGSLRAMPGQGGFPQLRKNMFQVHAEIEFDQEVSGPILLGAGRFRGYGLMRPWKVRD